MRLRNNIFAAAFDYLKREKGIKTQKRLAELMGVSEDTITRILKDRCEVTEDIITKLQTASGCIFNLQWLRGEDSTCMLAKDMLSVPEPQPIDQSSLVNAALAAKDETIAALRSQLADLRMQLVDKQNVIDAKDQLIDSLKMQINNMMSEMQIRGISTYPFEMGVSEKYSAPNKI